MVGRAEIRRLTADATGATAVEFALVGPLFLGVLFAIITFGLHLGVANSVQQLCSDIARASVAGIDERERVEIAENFLRANAHKYILLQPERIDLEVSESLGQPQFDVRVEYDASHLPLVIWTELFDQPPPVVKSVATVRHGGF